MKAEGAQFRYYLDNEVSTYDEILKKYSADLTVKVEGFNIFYTSPKKVHGGVISSSLPEEMQGKCWFPVTETGDVEEQLNAQQEIYWDKIINDSIEYYISLDKGSKTEEKACEGKKECANKLEFELDWSFIEQMAERMATNKGKYKPYNWQLPMNTNKLKQSLLRHTLEIMKGNDSDEGRALGHYESVALNAMMICYQLKNNL